MVIHDFEYQWHTELLTHTAATVVFAIDNSTNITKTATIQAGTFAIPESLDRDSASIVSESSATTTLGGIAYTLTYPTVYRGVADVHIDSTFPVTNSAGSVSCVSTKIELSGWFENVPNAPADPTSLYSCNYIRASPPRFLLRVSTLTAVSTSYIKPQATSSKILPSPTLSFPTVRATTTSSSYSPSSAEPSQYSTTDTSQPPNHAVPAEQTPASNMIQSSLSQPHSGEPTQPSLGSAPDVPTAQTSKVAHPIKQSTAGLVQPNEEASVPLTNSVATVVYVSGGSTKVAGYPSSSLHLDNSAIPIQTESNTASSITTLVNGLVFVVVPGHSAVSPIVAPVSVLTTVSRTSASLMPSASGIVFSSSTSLSSNPPHNAPVITVGSSAYTADAASNYVIDSQTLAPGSAVTRSGTLVSLMRSASGIVVASSTSWLPSPTRNQLVVTHGSSDLSGALSSIDAKGTVATLSTSTPTPGLGSLIMDAFGTVGPAPTPTVNAAKNINQFPTLAPLTIGNITFSADASVIVLSSTPYAIGAGASPTTVVVGNETLSLGPNGVAFPSTTVAMQSGTGVNPVAFTGGASRRYSPIAGLPSSMSSAGILLMLFATIMTS